MKYSSISLAVGFAIFLGSSLQAQESDNHPPVVQVLGAGPFVDETAAISYVLYDAEEDAGTLHYALYVYPNNALVKVEDIQIFATLIVDQRDLLDAKGTGDFVESASSTDVQTYIWGDPGANLRSLGFAPLNRMLEGRFYIYLVADDGVNEPVFAVSETSVHIDRSVLSTAVSERTWGELKANRR